MTTFSCRLNGALPGGERWSTGFHVDGAGTAQDTLNALVAACAILWNGNGGSIGGLANAYNAQTLQTSGVVYGLDPVTGKATSSAETAITHGGLSSSAPLPHEVAVVASLRTVTPGPSGRGRMYLPNPSVAAVGPTGELLDGIPQGFADSVAGMLSSMAAANLTPIIFSLGRVQRIIRHVEVGSVFDAQRRRRNQLVEVRSSALLT
jgi:hypothetical protein